MNDPKPFFWNGEHHLFYQYGPAANWGLRHWGHARSRDMVHWEHLPVALSPTPGGPDQEGCWTGCVVEHGGRFHILYTGVSPQTQCLASSDDLVHWQKHHGNPVIGQAAKPAGAGDCFRDPCAWREANAWRMVIGSQVPGAGGAALLYESNDLVHWTYLGPLFIGDPQQTGYEFECPDFFALADQHVLLTSSRSTYWHLGTYTGSGFTPDRVGLVDGGKYYAAKTLLDDRGRRILWGWIPEDRPRDQQQRAGWSGVMGLPRVMKVLSDGTLGFEPADELRSLRGAHRHLGSEHAIVAGAPASRKVPRELPGIAGRQLELLVRFKPSAALDHGLMIYASRDLSRGAEVLYNRNTRCIAGGTPLSLGRGEGLTLHLFVDHSVIEIFANGRACHTMRVYPDDPEQIGVAVVAAGGEAAVESVDAWEMTAIRPEG